MPVRAHRDDVSFLRDEESPISGVESLMDYRASLIGEISHGDPRLWLKVVVGVTSLCPCSKRISDYGAHNQRSHITINARVNAPMFLEELIDIAEQRHHASSMESSSDRMRST